MHQDSYTVVYNQGAIYNRLSKKQQVPFTSICTSTPSELQNNISTAPLSLEMIIILILIAIVLLVLLFILIRKRMNLVKKNNSTEHRTNPLHQGASVNIKKHANESYSEFYNRKAQLEKKEEKKDKNEISIAMKEHYITSAGLVSIEMQEHHEIHIKKALH